MDRSTIINKLNENYSAFLDLIAEMPEAEFTFSPDGTKWTPGQQLDHLCRSVAPLNKGLKAPEFALIAMFGKADHASSSYDELVARYQSELAGGGSAPAPFRPEAILYNKKDELLADLRGQIERLSKSIEKYDEEKLDKLVLPHPLLGKLTIREMLYFTIYHGEHHRRHTEQNLEKLASQ
ncbi:MAG TPA: DinB family protein [Pyrinomonadaceae bacterium]|nr:DinB family protein [Acidobacteriota bacterium]HQZ97400.1 DinB family protein [Pyrinomonadaceae bacterium]